MKNGYSNLIELLLTRSAHSPEQTAYTFLKDGETEESVWSYRHLDLRARQIAARLQASGAVDERVLLLYPPGLEFIAAFWGCLYAGAIAVPAYPPKMNRSFGRLNSIVGDCRASLALTNRQSLNRMRALIQADEQLKSLEWISTDDLAEARAEDLAPGWRPPRVTSDSLAFLQYTSGSTAAPRGVMVSHGNLLHNEALIQRAFRTEPQSVIVGWLPLYHDMGLIGNMLHPLYLGASCVLMSPAAFLQRPFRWLSAVSRYRGTVSGGPNMAYDLCARKITEEELAALDLRAWKVAFNGAEPVRPATLERFAARFAPVGFRRQAYCACYGLAESTLMVTGDARNEDPVLLAVDSGAVARGEVRVSPGADSEKSFVGCGGNVLGNEVRIVDPESLQPCAEGKIGEVWTCGPSVAQGYWNRTEETERVFRARISDGSGEAYLRTGDLGFLHQGELFVAGRLKDLIIIRGRNHYPQDLEQTMENAHRALRMGSCAAFAVEAEGEERLAVVQEVEHGYAGNPEEVVSAIRAAFSEQHELQPWAVTLIRAGSIPKTSSGKIQRFACRKMFLEGRLEKVFEWRLAAPLADASPADTVAFEITSAGDIERWLIGKLASRAGVPVEGIDAGEPISSFGLDSLAAIELEHAIERELGLSLPVSQLLQGMPVRQLAAELMESAAAGRAAEREIETPAEFPLSQGQRSLWFLQQLAPASTAYNLAFAVRMVNGLNTGAWRKACRALVQRHPSLRSTFQAVQGEPVQRVHPSLEGFFQEMDAALWSESRLRQKLEDAARCRFQLSEAPLFRMKVFRRPESGPIVLLVVHHIIADFWTLALMMHELTLLYRAESEGGAVELAPVTSSYAEFVRWQNGLLASAEGERLYRYWAGNLAGELPVSSLPADRPRPAVQTFAGASQTFTLRPELTARLQAVAQRNRATLYMTLLAAFQVLLARYSRQHDILVGSPAAARARAEWAGVAGYFVNTIVLRADLSGNPSFTGFLAQARATALGAFEHQHYPFPALVERLQPARDAGRSPVVQVMLAFEKTAFLQEEGIGALALGEAGMKLQFNGLTMEAAPLEEQSAIFDLMLMMAEVKDSLRGAFQYNVDLFDGSTIARMMEHWQRLLEAVTASPETAIEDLPLLSAEERHQILTGWNQTAAEAPGERSLIELFERQAAGTPQARAVVLGMSGEPMSYAELNRRANQLAHYLLRQGIGAEKLVGVCMERSLDLVVALLGVLKAGGAYVPLDPAYPEERLRYMMEDSDAPVLLTQENLLPLLAGIGGEKLCLDRDWNGKIASQSMENPAVRVQPENLAYLIYTSGSTGRAKAVMITHRSALVLCHWAHRTFADKDLAGVLASTSVCFDISVFELFAPLSWGGSAIVVKNVFDLAEMEDRDKVTLINTVPSAMVELLRMTELPRSAGVVNLAGEALGRELVQRVYGNGSVREVYNLYGPSEDTTYSTYRLIPAEEEWPLIGRPVSGTQVYVLDEALQPVPVGVTGEIYIAGEGLARGYLGRAEMTAEKFLPDPYSVMAGGRLYRTGDLGRYRAEGVLEYQGRADHQVKIRGYRIELGEIEAVLSECAGVKAAVVLAREDTPGDKRLVGYVVLEEGVRAEQIRRMVRQKLPEYMTPGVLVEMEKLPITPSGKLDRRRLPEPEAASAEQYVAPRTAVEEIVVRIWAEVLRVKQVGLRDNFFDLGGHSLLATRLISRLKEAFPVDLKVRVLFEAPTVEEMARRLEASVPADEETPELIPVSRELHRVRVTEEESLPELFSDR